MRKLFTKWRTKNSLNREQYEKKRGLNPPTTTKTYQENPFYQLYDLYGFDIHMDSPVEFLHVGVIDIFKNDTISIKPN
jgi:hypothetical protein